MKILFFACMPSKLSPGCCVPGKCVAILSYEEVNTPLSLSLSGNFIIGILLKRLLQEIRVLYFLYYFFLVKLYLYIGTPDQVSSIFRAYSTTKF